METSDNSVRTFFKLIWFLMFLSLFFVPDITRPLFASDFFGSVYVNEIETPYNALDLGLELPDNQEVFYVDSITGYVVKPLSMWISSYPDAYVYQGGNIQCVLDGDQNSMLLMYFTGLTDTPIISGPTTWRNGGGEFAGHSCTELIFNPPIICLDDTCASPEFMDIFSYMTLSVRDPMDVDRSMEFGLSILISLMFVITIGFIFNSINKKPKRY